MRTTEHILTKGIFGPGDYGVPLYRLETEEIIEGRRVDSRPSTLIGFDVYSRNGLRIGTIYHPELYWLLFDRVKRKYRGKRR